MKSGDLQALGHARLSVKWRTVPHEANTTKPAFELAKAKSPAYVYDSKFRLQFLRADYFNPRDAAARFVAYFEMKQELFGVDKLCEEIKYSDLRPQTVAVLESGYTQLLDGKDTSGRPIHCVVPVNAAAIPHTYLST